MIQKIILNFNNPIISRGFGVLGFWGIAVEGFGVFAIREGF